MENDPQDVDRQPAVEDSEPDALSPTFVSLQKALEAARNRLLDRSLTNKLINTDVASPRARQVRIFDRESDDVFRQVRAGRVTTFVATVRRGASDDRQDRDLAVDGQADDDVGARGEAGPRANRLPTRLTSDGLSKRLTSLLFEGRTIEEEQGVSVLFLALGFLEWREAKQSEIARFAPLVLLPVELVRDGARDRFTLRPRQDDLYTNVSLQAWLMEQFGIDLPELPEGDDWQPSAYFAAVEAAIGARPGWAVRPNEIVLGFFSFSKFLMWRDLDPANWPDPKLLADHPLLKRILLRDDEDSEPLDKPLVGPDERVDEVFTPAELVHVTDADSSQAIAIQEAMAGKNLVIQGPPGTGKSQTITNIIAGAVKRGKRVLFVAEKMAALEVVHQRLVDRKVSAMCLELHSRKSSKVQVLEQIRQARAAPSRPAWPSGAMKDLADTQIELRAFSDRMHRSGLAAFTPFDLIGRISLLKERGAPAPTFTMPAAATWSSDRVEAERRRAAQLGERITIAGPPRQHPWRGVGIPAPNLLEQDRLRPVVARVATAIERLSQAVAEARGVLLPQSVSSIENLATWAAALEHLAVRPAAADAVLADDKLVASLEPLTSISAAGERLAAIRTSLADKLRSDAWMTDWAPTRKIIAGHGRSLFRMFSGRYREAVADLRGSWIGELPNDHKTRVQALDDLIDGIRLAEVVRSAAASIVGSLGPLWNGEASDWVLLRSLAAWLAASQDFEPAIRLRRPDALINVGRARSMAAQLRAALSELDQAISQFARAVELDEPLAFGGRARAQLTVEQLTGLIQGWLDRFSDVAQWPPIRDDLKWLQTIGAELLAQQIFDGEVAGEQIEDVLLLAVYEAMWARVCQQDPEIGRAAGDELNRLVSRFRKSDLDRIALAADEVGRAHADSRPAGSGGPVGILEDELRKVRNIKPVRKLMEFAGDAVQAFKPVFLMSPLSVAQYLPPGLIKFDMLVIDEASQIRPEDAIGAIARCNQVVVVGDDKQLPPTNFFNRMINDGDDGEDDDVDETVGAPRRAALKDIESILNLCSRFPERMLRWHYRSEHPGLIAISNRNFYRNQLLLPPSVIAGVTDGSTGLIFHKVQEGGYDRGKTRANEIEAEDIAQAALKHARECPELSLGIGAFSVSQRDVIRDRLHRLCGLYPELDDFMKGGSGEARREPVFVKNLENIQGDERDVIFISVGYGKDKDGRLYQSFGPVGGQGGERRLNVLITRARKRCEVFSSIVAEDIRLDGAAKPGVAALKEFLKLAQDGFIDTPFDTGKSFDSDFEEAVAYEIKALGYDFRPQVGMAGFFIDIGVVDPNDAQRYVLGVECDGAAYHSSQYARDRDRLRQMILERRGWKLHRIWSTDWFYQRDREVQKLKEAIEAALAGRPLPTAANVYDFEPLEPAPPSGVEEPTVDESVAVVARNIAGLRRYELAKFKFWSTEPHNLGDAQLAEVVERIVKIEQPIHEEEVCRRLAHVCGLQRAGSRIQDAGMRGLEFARTRRRSLTSDRGFWSENPSPAVEPRYRGDLAASEMVRKPELISPAEFAAAAVVALRRNLALSRDELVTETARLIGIARVGEYVRDAIEEAIDHKLVDLTERDHLGRIKLKPPEPPQVAPSQLSSSE